MPAKKTHDIAVKTGEYQDRQSGETKGRWQNIGALMEGDDGHRFLILERTFNPAGMPNPENRETIIASCFPPRTQNREEDYRNSPRGQRAGSSGITDDEIPF